MEITQAMALAIASPREILSAESTQTPILAEVLLPIGASETFAAELLKLIRRPALRQRDEYPVDA